MKGAGSVWPLNFNTEESLCVFSGELESEYLDEMVEKPIKNVMLDVH